jgi:carbon storage regulator
MLILHRYENESIIINQDIIIKICELNSKQVKLGIIAPKSYQVHREEIFKRIHGYGINDLIKKLGYMESP